MKEVSILVIDDEPSIIALLEDILTDGYNNDTIVHTALTNAEALQILTQKPCDVIISDLYRPAGSGFDFLEYMKMHNINIPVIIQSGYTLFENAWKALALGAVDYLPKTYIFEHLTNALQAALGHPFASISEKTVDPELQETLQRNRPDGKHVVIKRRYYGNGVLMARTAHRDGNNYGCWSLQNQRGVCIVRDYYRGGELSESHWLYQNGSPGIIDRYKNNGQIKRTMYNPDGTVKSGF